MWRVLLATAVFVILAALPSSLFAQARPVTVGDVIRVRTRDSAEATKGTLGSMTASEWTLSLAGGEFLRLDPSRIGSLELRTMRNNALAGTLLGTLGGVLIGAAGMAGSSCEGSACSAVEGSVEGLAMVMSTALGAGVGALIGLSVKTEQWIPAYLPAGEHPGSVLGLVWTRPVPR